MAPKLGAEEIVARKLSQFARGRRKIAHDFADHLKIPVPPEVDQLFDALETGRWDDAKAQFKALEELRRAASGSEALCDLWPVIQDAYGAAEQAHLWPAQLLLDYGHSVLDALSPGMVYLGGTDAGRWIPELLNDTSDGEQHIMLMQNALSDNSYLDYLGFRYGGRLNTLSNGDHQRAFQDFIADVQKRFLHDQRFPDEPRQLRPGEAVIVGDGRVQVSGQPAVMAVNEVLLQNLLQKNPEMHFAIEESFSLPSTYANAAPLGPLIELRTPGGADALTAESAAQSLAYWNAAVQPLLSDPVASTSSEVLQTYSREIAAQANLFAANSLPAQAEQGYRVATQLFPADPQTATAYANLLIAQDHLADAAQVANNALAAAPDNKQAQDLAQRVARLQAGGK